MPTSRIFNLCYDSVALAQLPYIVAQLEIVPWPHEMGLDEITGLRISTENFQKAIMNLNTMIEAQRYNDTGPSVLLQHTKKSPATYKLVGAYHAGFDDRLCHYPAKAMSVNNGYLYNTFAYDTKNGQLACRFYFFIFMECVGDFNGRLLTHLSGRTDQAQRHGFLIDCIHSNKYNPYKQVFNLHGTINILKKEERDNLTYKTISQIQFTGFTPDRINLPVFIE